MLHISSTDSFPLVTALSIDRFCFLTSFYVYNKAVIMDTGYTLTLTAQQDAQKWSVID